MNKNGNGYDIYDLWDLGEFDQKGARSTKWGSIEELKDLLAKARELNLEVTWDTVINHKTGGDGTEDVWAVEVDPDDRRIEICPPKKITAWLKYDFPGRQQSASDYSSMKWRSDHFNGTDWDHAARKKAIYMLISDPATHLLPKNRPPRPLGSSSPSKKDRAPSEMPARRPGKGWSDDVDDENGNNDYLMFCNIDYTHPEVRQEVNKWGAWMINSIGVDGFRVDAAQHIPYGFMRDWVQQVNEAALKKTMKEVFVVGEVWTGELERIVRWLDAVQPPSGIPNVRAFDAPLLYRFSHLSEAVKEAEKPLPQKISSKLPPPLKPDLRTILEESLVSARSEAAVTMVTNHDTQPGQVCATPMDRDLKLLFYAFILLREEGLPCVFWGDLFGTHGPHAEGPVGVGEAGHSNVGVNPRSILADLIVCRQFYAYGKQQDYWDSPMCVGWTRCGVDGHGGCVVVLSIDQNRGEDRSVKEMNIGKPGETWVDIVDSRRSVIIDEEGCGTFSVGKLGVGVYVPEASGYEKHFPAEIDLDVYG